jgi:hypothetical protein
VLTLCVDTRGSLQGLYGCLRAIHLTGLDEAAEIVLIDDGGSDEAALLPALVGNLRYWRLQPGQCLPEARNRAALPMARDYVAFLSAAARVTPDWLPQMRAAFAARPDCAVIGARLAGPDGGTVVSGLLPDRTGRLADVEDVEADDPVPVAAVIDAAVILRGAVFTELGGFAAGFTEARAAMIDLCLRCWDAGYAVFYQPDCALLWRDEGRLAATAEDPLDPEVAALLAYRWAHSPRAAWPRAAAPILGRALLLDVPEAEATAAALRGLGYDVTRAAEAATDGAYDLVILGTGAAPNAIGARIVVVPDPETEALLSQPAAASKPRVKDALAAVAAADCVIIRTDIAEARLRKLGFGDRLWQLGDWRTLLRHLALPSAAAADRPYE